MKVRTAFVSNSSSSSYLIAFKDGAFGGMCPTCGRARPGLPMTEDEPVEYIKSIIDQCSKDLEDYVPLGDKTVHGSQIKASDFVESARLSITEHTVLLSRVVGYVAQGYNVGYASIGYYEYDTKELFDKLVEDGSIIIIEREET